VAAKVRPNLIASSSQRRLELAIGAKIDQQICADDRASTDRHFKALPDRLSLPEAAPSKAG
jgi:hypothetical protein